ncbi:MAG: Mov34/MPN/PAD-1 family protein [Burkholderiales bacterium]
MPARIDSIRLPPELRRRILEHSLSRPREETCGLIGGLAGRPATYYPITNDAGDRARRFLMNAEEQVDAMRRMRDAGESLLGIVHSHPDAPPLPSATDLELASYPDVVYVIASLESRAPLLRAFHYDGTAFRELLLE